MSELTTADIERFRWMAAAALQAEDAHAQMERSGLASGSAADFAAEWVSQEFADEAEQRAGRRSSRYKTWGPLPTEMRPAAIYAIEAVNRMAFTSSREEVIELLAMAALYLQVEP